MVDDLVTFFVLLVAAPFIDGIFHHGLQLKRMLSSYRKIFKDCTLRSPQKGLLLALIASVMALFLNLAALDVPPSIFLVLVVSAITWPAFFILGNAILPDGITALMLSMAANLLFAFSFFADFFLSGTEWVSLPARIFLACAFLSSALLIGRAAPVSIDPERLCLIGKSRAILCLTRANLVVLSFYLAIDLVFPELPLWEHLALQCLCAWVLFLFGQISGNLGVVDVPSFFLIGSAFVLLSLLTWH